MARHGKPYDPASDVDPDSLKQTAGAARESEARRPRRRWPRSRFGRFVLDSVVMIGCALLVAMGVRLFLVQSFYIPSASMESTLMIGDRILVNELQPEVIPLHRGDIVVFKDPGGWLPKNLTLGASQDPLSAVVNAPFAWLTGANSNDHLVKRIVGLPGDHVSCCSATGKLTVNGVEVTEPYVMLPPGTSAVSDIDFDVVVPADSLFVMGDNRYNSSDSRYHADTPTHGFVPYSNVVGTAFLVTWPVTSIKWLGDYSANWKVVPEPAKKAADTLSVGEKQPAISPGDFTATPLAGGNG